MAKGKEKHQERLDAINLLGKDLARRARRKCELCEAGEDIRPFDTAPEQEPSMDTLALLCERCRTVLGGRKDDPQTLRFLEGAVWSEHAPVADAARRMIESVDSDWARATLDLL